MKVLFVAPKSGSAGRAAKTIMSQRCDVETMTQCCGKKGGRYCVAGGEKREAKARRKVEDIAWPEAPI